MRINVKVATLKYVKVRIPQFSAGYYNFYELSYFL